MLVTIMVVLAIIALALATRQRDADLARTDSRFDGACAAVQP